MQEALFREYGVSTFGGEAPGFLQELLTRDTESTDLVCLPVMGGKAALEHLQGRPKMVAMYVSPRLSPLADVSPGVEKLIGPGLKEVAEATFDIGYVAVAYLRNYVFMVDEGDARGHESSLELYVKNLSSLPDDDLAELQALFSTSSRVGGELVHNEVLGRYLERRAIRSADLVAGTRKMEQITEGRLGEFREMAERFRASRAADPRRRFNQVSQETLQILIYNKIMGKSEGVPSEDRGK